MSQVMVRMFGLEVPPLYSNSQRRQSMARTARTRVHAARSRLLHTLDLASHRAYSKGSLSKIATLESYVTWPHASDRSLLQQLPSTDMAALKKTVQRHVTWRNERRELGATKGSVYLDAPARQVTTGLVTGQLRTMLHGKGDPIRRCSYTCSTPPSAEPAVGPLRHGVLHTFSYM